MSNLIADGVDKDNLVWEQDKAPCREPILRAARKLERMGCKAIAAKCGYFAYFQKDMIPICRRFCKTHPDIGAIMLECTGMQPFARAVQQAIDLPIFSCSYNRPQPASNHHLKLRLYAFLTSWRYAELIHPQNYQQTGSHGTL